MSVEMMVCMDRRMGVLLMAFMIYHFSTGDQRIKIGFSCSRLIIKSPWRPAVRIYVEDRTRTSVTRNNVGYNSLLTSSPKERSHAEFDSGDARRRHGCAARRVGSSPLGFGIGSATAQP